MNKKDLGSKLENLRMRLPKEERSLEKVANKIGMANGTTLSQIENGHIGINKKYYSMICKVLKYPKQDLIRDILKTKEKEIKDSF